MLSELTTSEKVVGLKQLKKALRDGTASKVFYAEDADPRMLTPILDACRTNEIPSEKVPSMQELGRACGIEVGAAVAALLHSH